jgi:hypothetical protein
MRTYGSPTSCWYKHNPTCICYVTVIWLADQMPVTSGINFPNFISPITQNHKSEVLKWIHHEVLCCYVCASLVKGRQNYGIWQFLCWVLTTLKTNNSGKGGTDGRIQDMCYCVCVQRPASSYKLQTKGNQVFGKGQWNVTKENIGLCHSAVEVFTLLRC